MASSRVYLDHNATTPLRPEARAAWLEAIDQGGNPSSVHREGRQARARVEAARLEVAALFGARTGRVCFTSGGTEAAHLALTPRLGRKGQGPFGTLLMAAGEHAAVLHGHSFADCVVLPLDREGRLDLAALERQLAGTGPSVLALQAANNETGVLQPLHEAARLVHAAGGVLISDAVQFAGRLPWDRTAHPADLVLVSGHKLGAGPGAGALVGFGDEPWPEAPLLRGGGQERGLRGGTENVPAIAAFGAVAALVREAPDAARLAGLRDRFEAALLGLAAEAVLFGAAVPRLPNTCAFALPGIPAETLMMALDLGGIGVSSGSACSSGKVGRSHVLEAMGVPSDLRRGAIRVSFGWTSSAADVDAVVGVIGEALRRMAVRRIGMAA